MKYIDEFYNKIYVARIEYFYLLSIQMKPFYRNKRLFK